MTSVEIAELGEQAAGYLRRMKAGETITVTEHGKPVAELRRLPESTIERLEREGWITQAEGDLLELAPMLPPDGLPPLSEILAGLREYER
jgi:antitoxin (DNA-binding transcriptional repressor) of toxin-antitoxin stability system